MKKYCIFLIFVFLTVSVCAAHAQEKITAAVAANFMKPFQDIIKIYQQQTQIKVEAAYTSTGKLYSQIINGAPYDIFLAADEKRPDLLYKGGFSEKPFVYAQGQVVVWTAKKELCQAKTWQEMIQLPDVKKIAIANIKTAPYGTVSMLALKSEKLWQPLQSKMVFAETIAQVFQYAFTESTDTGFCAFSSTFTEQGKKGCFLEVKEALPVIQAACVLKRTTKKELNDQFAAFLSSSQAISVKKNYGYK